MVAIGSVFVGRNYQSHKPWSGKPGFQSMNKLPEGHYWYKIQRGDTLTRIIIHEEMKLSSIQEGIDKILRLNPFIHSPEIIHAGDFLVLPNKEI